MKIFSYVLKFPACNVLEHILQSILPEKKYQEIKLRRFN